LHIVSVIGYWSSSVAAAAAAAAITNVNVQKAMTSLGATTKTTNTGIVLPNVVLAQISGL
jgi:ABC-type spermidine/putrescine transport system permease subunit II